MKETKKHNISPKKSSIRSKAAANENEDAVINIVFIGGFLFGDGWMPFPPEVQESFPSHVRFIPVYPSNLSSLHDRVMQIFYGI